MNTLFIISDGPYGSERPYNALRLAMNLVKRDGQHMRVILMGDGVQKGSMQLPGDWTVEADKVLVF